MNPEQIIKLIRQELQKFSNINYISGVPKLAPHQHNGIDNLQINAKDIIGLKTGTPGGTNTQVQFNDNGAFNGDSGLTYDKVSGILGVHDINNNLQPPSDGFDLSIQAVLGTNLLFTTNNVDSMANPLGPTGNIVLASDDIDGFDTGDVTVNTGTATTSGETGDLNLKTGTATGTTNTGKIVLATGNTTVPNNGNGSLSIYSQKLLDISASGVSTAALSMIGAASVTMGAANGFVLVFANDSSSTGNIRLRAVSQSPTANHGNLSFGSEATSPNFGGGTGVFFFENSTTIATTTPTGGGVLYVTGGALHWLGSSGTDTTIAPA